MWNNNNNLEKWFFSFWIRNLRLSFLLIFLIIISWIFSLFSIPKESSPDIDFWIINVSIIYPGVNPEDIDTLITEKVEKTIDNLEGIKKISSTSSVWVSTVTIELDIWVDSRDMLTDIKEKVDKLDLPDDSNDPIVMEISSNNSLIYEVLLYWDKEDFDDFSLYTKAQIIKNKLEWQNWISDINIWWLDNLKWSANIWDNNNYEIRVLLDKDKLEKLGLNLMTVSNIIKINNKDTPLWNFKIWELYYDFRFKWKLNNIEDLKNIVIRDKNNSKLFLKDIAVFKREYNLDEIKRFGSFELSGMNYISITFNKHNNASIFESSKNSKESLEKLIHNNVIFDWLNVEYSKDMWKLIIEDYNNLSSTAIVTLLLVFITIIFFVWFREGVIAVLLLPIAFLITFITLDNLGLSLNFLTNFSLVLTLWIAIDTVIVIIEWASEKMKLGFTRKTAILIAIRDFKAPLITWTLTTLVAFLPLMFLPGVIGKFLSFIPITVFSTLLAALILSLTLSSAIFIKIMKSKKSYHKDKKLEYNLHDTDLLILNEERKWKESKSIDTLSIREKFLIKMWNLYEILLYKVIKSRFLKSIFIIWPIFLLLCTLIFLSPKIWFIIFPNTDEWIINIDVTGKIGVDEKYMYNYVNNIEKKLSNIQEIDKYYIKIKSNKISVYIDLLEKNIRKDRKLRDIYNVEKDLSNKLSYLLWRWLDVSISVLKNWPPTWSAVWIKLVSDTVSDFSLLKRVSYDFEEYLKNINWTKNIITSSVDSPGQFIFTFIQNKLETTWLNRNDILNELYLYTNGINVWSIKSKYEDNNIIVSLKEFENFISPEDIENLIINTKIWKIRVGDFVKYSFEKSVNTITRENNKIIISVWSELEKDYLPTDIQPLLNKFALGYNFPSWINYIESGEWEDNKELIISTIKSLFISLFLIFTILVYQLNSFKQPFIVLYSIILALLGVNIGLYLTWNPYSMPFAIWFIALTWIVVNDAIILMDRINKTISLKKEKISSMKSIISASKSRLQPIIVTTLTTIFWILPLALTDEFWAGLGYTIIFWLFVWSFMTLFVIPILYNMFIIKKIRKK